MRIGIDISQLAYENTGVANYLSSLLKALIENDRENEYVLFFSSMRKNLELKTLNFKLNKNVSLKTFKLAPKILDLLCNRLHIMPVENFIGPIDLFITSDWTEPPTKKAKKATIIYDMIVHKYPQETDKKIVQTQKRKLKWVKKESSVVF